MSFFVFQKKGANTGPESPGPCPKYKFIKTVTKQHTNRFGGGGEGGGED
jgi:hypothetical protein